MSGKSLYAKSAVWIYAALTQIIIWAGNIREALFDDWASSRWDEDWQVRADRTFKASTSEAMSCCDCGLVHVALPRQGAGKAVNYRLRPIRPVGYRYQLRASCPPPAPFFDESNT